MPKHPGSSHNKGKKSFHNLGRKGTKKTAKVVKPRKPKKKS